MRWFIGGVVGLSLLACGGGTSDPAILVPTPPPVVTAPPPPTPPPPPPPPVDGTAAPTDTDSAVTTTPTTPTTPTTTPSPTAPPPAPPPPPAPVPSVDVVTQAKADLPGCTVEPGAPEAAYDRVVVTGTNPKGVKVVVRLAYEKIGGKWTCNEAHSYVQGGDSSDLNACGRAVHLCNRGG